MCNVKSSLFLVLHVLNVVGPIESRFLSVMVSCGISSPLFIVL